ncbi:hypothetical protein CROQUDRAFT_88868, partial [Cronartium quercuum f. sp. fusiforme G11]
MFPSCAGNPSITKALDKLHHLLEVALPLPKRGSKAVTVNSNSAANICVLVARIMEMDERRSMVRFQAMEFETEEEQGTHPTASSNSFAFKVPDMMEAKMDGIQHQLNMVTEQLASFAGQKTKTTAPQKSNQPECPSATNHSINPAPSYALATSKHTQPATPPAPKKHMAKKAQKAESESSLEIKQLISGGNALASLKQKDLITLINNMLTAPTYSSLVAQCAPLASGNYQAKLGPPSNP